MKPKYILSGVIFVLAATIVVAFQNCGQGFGVASLPLSTSASSITSQQKQATNCQADAICFNGKIINFTNDNGAAVQATLLTSTDNGFTAKFTTPAGRTMTAMFTLQGNTLVATAANGSRPQFCAVQSTNIDDRCSLMTVNNLQQFNCGSALHWTGGYTGDTKAQETVCTAPVQTATSQQSVTVDPAVAAYINYLQQTLSDVSQRLSSPNTNDAEKSVIQGLVNAPTSAPPGSYGAQPAHDPSTLPQLSMGCSNREEAPQPNENVIPYGPPIDLANLPLAQLGALKVDTSLSCVPYGQWCIVAFRGKSDGTCTAAASVGPAYNCTSSWVLSCKQFCESTMKSLNLPSGRGWTCNYGNYYGSTPNHDPNAYKETDRQGVAWDL